ncbi:MAG: hypothetical protein Q4C18_00765 [Eubacteriales bacterium]|nr:hypothetical protein [Eubacteriales bacterium]
MNKLNITWCWPDVLNLHGDRGNVMALERIGKKMGLSVEVHKTTNFGDSLDFKQTDVLLLNPGEFKSNEYIVNAFRNVKDQLDAYIEEGGVILTVGTTGAAFGKTIRRLDGSTISGLGYLDMECAERDNIVGDDLITRMRGTDFELNGSQIQVMDTTLSSDVALSDVEYGYGNNGYEEKHEGARYKNLIFTNMLGPVLVKNPWLAQHLIQKAMERKGVSIPELPVETFELERKSLECIRKYNRTKADK